MSYPIPPSAIAWLKNSTAIRYLHRFDRSCNVLNQNDALLSFVLPSIGLGPFSLIVPENVMETLRRGEVVRVLDGGRLEIGDWRLEIGEETAVWNPVPQWANLKSHSFAMHSVPLLPQIIQERFDYLLEQIRAENEAEVALAVQRLAGLGDGLTPVGDDVLMGVLFALWVEQPDSPLIPLIGNTAVPLTTTLSAAFLKSAVAGEATIHWHELAEGHPQAKEKILSIGYSSGAAAWQGFVQTIDKSREKREKS